MPYDPAAFFQINIYDDGPTQSYGGHNANAEKVFEDDTAYLSEMFSRTLAVTEQLNEEKLLLLLRRYMGVSVQLPVHYGVDESAYGSLTVYRDEIVDEMALYAQDHTLDVLEFYVLHAICGKPDAGTLQQAWEEIRYQISSGK